MLSWMWKIYLRMTLIKVRLTAIQMKAVRKSRSRMVVRGSTNACLFVIKEWQEGPMLPGVLPRAAWEGESKQAMLGNQYLGPPEYFHCFHMKWHFRQQLNLILPLLIRVPESKSERVDVTFLLLVNWPGLDCLRRKIAMMTTMVTLTWERNLLTLLLGGCVTLPGLFLPRSWNLSVIFLWGFKHVNVGNCVETCW